MSELFELLIGEDIEEEEELGWQERALCAQTDPESFFPEKGGSTREAKKVCLACEVRSECLEYALANDERFGIWGGLSERERRGSRRARLTRGVRSTPGPPRDPPRPESARSHPGRRAGAAAVVRAETSGRPPGRRCRAVHEHAPGGPPVSSRSR